MDKIEPEIATYSGRVRKIIHFAILFSPLLMLGYGLMIQFGVITGSQNYYDVALWILTLLLLIIGLTQPKTKPMSTLRLLILQLIMVGYALFVVGVESIAIVWLPVVVIAALNQGIKTLWWSALVLLLTGFIDGMLQSASFNNEVFLSDVATLSGMFFAAIVLIAISISQSKEYQSLVRTRRREVLQRSRLLALINGLDSAVISTNAAGIIQIHNTAALSLLDTTYSLSSHKIEKVLNLHQANGKKIKWQDLFGNITTAIIRDDLVHHFADGEKMRLSVTCAPIRLDAKAKNLREGYIFILRDITKQKSLDETRDEFISVVSHELRTPITAAEAAISNTQLLVERAQDPEDIAPNLEKAHNEILYLSNIVNDLETLARAEQKASTHTDEVDINKLFEKLYHEYHPQVNTRKVALNISVDPRVSIVETNQLYLEEILQNLIANAIKYTHEGSITISAKHRHDGVHFAVKDTGIGVGKTDRNKIFDKFYRSEDYRTRETSGTGLGLYVVQKLAEKIGTEIELATRLNHGSTFSFLLRQSRQERGERIG
ncbi:hypothetical protein KC939_02640 [Candidatus Saccharibacteria bacterium]|nr:hypothetical protein [Candidatus Saccharibacteria bacterium]